MILFRSFFIFLFLVSSFIFAQDKIKIPASTVVVVKSTRQLSSKQLKTGQEVILTVATNVNVKGNTVIKAGSPVISLVETAESAGMVGQAGRLTISIQSTTAVDGSNVSLSGNFYTKGESKTGESVAVGVILCPLALLCKGEEGDIPAGAQARALTMGEYDVVLENVSTKDTLTNSPQKNEKKPDELKEAEFQSSFSAEIKSDAPQTFFSGKVSLSVEIYGSKKAYLKAKGIWGFSENLSGPFESASITISKDQPVFMQIDEKTVYKIEFIQQSDTALSLQFTKQ